MKKILFIIAIISVSCTKAITDTSHYDSFADLPSSVQESVLNDAGNVSYKEIWHTYLSNKEYYDSLVN